jgi:hypothetical protein
MREKHDQANAPKRLQVLIDAHPEHGQAIQTETDAEVVHDTDIQIARFCGQITLVVLAECLEDQGDNRKDGFDLYVF